MTLAKADSEAKAKTKHRYNTGINYNHHLQSSKYFYTTSHILCITYNHNWWLYQRTRLRVSLRPGHNTTGIFHDDRIIMIVKATDSEQSKIAFYHTQNCIGEKVIGWNVTESNVMAPIVTRVETFSTCLKLLFCPFTQPGFLEEGVGW
jgi:hypothetical protein